MSLDVIEKGERARHFLQELVNAKDDLSDSDRSEIRKIVASLATNLSGFEEADENSQLFPNRRDYINTRDSYIQGVAAALSIADRWLNEEWQLLPKAIEHLRPLLDSVQNAPKAHWDLYQRKPRI